MKLASPCVHSSVPYSTVSVGTMHGPEKLLFNAAVWVTVSHYIHAMYSRVSLFSVLFICV